MQELMPGFKFIPGFEELYSINESGDIWAHRAKKFLSPYFNQLGYPMVNMFNTEGKRKRYLVHRMVALTYLSVPEYKCEVNHKDGNKKNPHVSNLEWITHKENIHHAHKTGLCKMVEKMEWWTWTPEQLEAFEKSPYNIPACGPYEYPPDLADRIKQIELTANLEMAV